MENTFKVGLEQLCEEVCSDGAVCLGSLGNFLELRVIL